MRRRKIWSFVLGHVLLLLGMTSVTGFTGISTTREQDCYLQLIQDAPDNMTIGEARELCNKRVLQAGEPAGESQKPEESGVLARRLKRDSDNILQPFSLMSHRENYILAAVYNFQGWQTDNFEDAYNSESISLQDYEVQFQLSIKTPLALDIFDSGVDFYGAYTLRSFWQAYNADISSPFRETNHEPEIWLQFTPNFELFGFTNTINALGFSHQSNGQASTLSRSWNRIWATITFERGDFALMLTPWLRIQESSNDDNPDITDYLGHGSLQLIYRSGDHTYSFMSRNNIESGFSRGAVQLSWSFPILGYHYLKGYVQYFSGYGESLIDYDSYVNRVGIGILITNLL